MTYSATASVPTDNGSRYLQQLCKHWAHNLAVDYTTRKGAIIFPKNARGANWPDDATVVMEAMPGTLECRIGASAAEQLNGLKEALARHLDRFAFREAPLRFDWRSEV